LSRLPQLEAQLVAAAARRPRSRVGPRVAGGALAAAACVLAAVLLLTPGPKPRDQPVQATETVPPSTLVQARALAAMAPPRNTFVRDAMVAPVAKRVMAQTPYPPGMSDHFDWRAHGYGLNHAAEVQRMVEYRAYCLWLKYWLTGTDRAGAAAVLAEVPSWPTQRQTDKYESSFQREIQAAVEGGDVVRVKREADLNCQRVG
jgi:hypothetical protein